MTAVERMRLRNAIVDLLRVRKESIPDEVIQERANNGVFYLEEIVDDIVTAALKDAARGEVIVGSIEGREPWNERGSETKSESPSPESSGPVPAERLTGIEVSMERSSPAASAAVSTQDPRRISAGRMGRHLEDLGTDEGEDHE